MSFLRNIVTVEDSINPSDEKAIAHIEAIFKSAIKFSFRKKAKAAWFRIKNTKTRILSRKKPT